LKQQRILNNADQQHTIGAAECINDEPKTRRGLYPEQQPFSYELPAASG
jgi:hypothetical protein